MKRMTKVLSLLLACMLLFNSMMFGAVSQEALPTETETASNMSAVIDDKYEAGDEIVEWREEGVKHYYLGDGTCQAVIRADEEMLQKKSEQGAARSSITVTSSKYPSDTHISSSAQTTNYGETDGVRVGTVAIGLFWHSKKGLPKDINILSAAYHFAYYYNVSDGYMTVGAYAVEEFWDEYTVTWDDMEVYPNLGISTTLSGSATLTASPTCNVNNPTWAAVDITDIVRSWYSGERYNEGIALKRTGGNNNSVIIKSFESEQEAYRSYYTITYTLIDNRVSNGEYYFQNAKFEMFAEIDNNASATDEGAIIEIWDFNADDDQRWNITYLYNGYYKIISSASGKALTAPTSTDASITQTVYTGTNKQQWIFTKNTDGTYKLSPRSNEAFYMAAGAGIITARGRNVEMRENQSDNRDDWNLLLVTNYVNLSLKTRVFYDDESVNYSENYMETKYVNAASPFLTEFNIEFEVPAVSASDQLAVSNTCVHKTNLSEGCGSECGAENNCNTQHHKSSRRLITLLTSSSYYTYRIVGYAVCRYEDGHAVVVGSGNINGKNAVSSTLISSDITRSIQHELTHNLGGSHGTCTPGQHCVLKGQKNKWCDACSEAIKNNH